jgi:hypothetical protein
MTAVALEPEAILGLACLQDPEGIISIYADGPEPGEPSDRAAEELRVALNSFERRERDRLPHERWERLHLRLDALRPEIEQLASPRLHGRGRALFAGIENAEMRTIEIQYQVPTSVECRPHPNMRPVLAALGVGAPAGIVTVSRGLVRLIDSRMGESTEIARFDIAVDTSTWRKMHGPSSPNPLQGQESASQEDRFRRRIEDERRRELMSLAPHLAAAVYERGWVVVLVAGAEENAAALTEHVSVGIQIARDPSDLAPYLTAAEVADTLAPALAKARSSSTAAAVARARDAALSGGRGALGLADVLTALAEGRVHELLVDVVREFDGVETPDGRLWPAGIVPPGVDRGQLSPEPQMIERMVTRAAETNATVTPLDATAAEGLAENDGVAAILRW